MNDDTILIEIAAFKESELLNTVRSALLQADNPDRVHFGICYQNNIKMDDYKELIKLKNCKIKYYREAETKGLCFARNVCQHLIEDEKYVLQIDAHMRFVKHWDTGMIKQLLGTKDDHAIISFYPPNCLEDMMTLPLDDPKFDEPGCSVKMIGTGFRDYPSYFISLNSYPLDRDGKYRRSPFISGGNFFSFSEVHKEVYNDPSMFFYGDELPMAIRLFTHGWNVYDPDRSYIYHQYERKNQAFPKVTNHIKIEIKRFSNLLGISNDVDLGEYGLGTKRTLKEYEDFSGIDFRNRIISPKCRNGLYAEKVVKMPLKKFKRDITSILQEREHIYVVMVDLLNNYVNCIKSCLSKSNNPSKIHFIVGTRGGKLPDHLIKKYQIDSISYFTIKSSYSEILADISKKADKGIVAILDSSYLFLQGWDEYYSKQLGLCGENSAITSWIWHAPKQKDYLNLHPYNNIAFAFKSFYDCLPFCEYNKDIVMGERMYPYQIPFNINGFYFGYAHVFKKVPFDPNLNFQEQNAVYSARLWTNGINLYLPNISHMVRTVPEDSLSSGERNRVVTSGIFNLEEYYANRYPPNYLYGLGNERPMWAFYDFAHIKYDK